jgi:selenocysteine lyase/cysteine desulfurase
VIGDGVSYAPHGFPDVKELGVDFYTFSLYKTYGPHLALLYGKEDILKKLPNQNHQFLEGSYPYTINPGGPNHEELASLIGIYEYMMELHKHHFNNDDIQIKEKISQVNHLISKHEEEVANPILNYITSREDLKLIGKNKIKNKNRAPTISITNKQMSSKQMSKILVNNNIATRNDNFYAWRCLKALNINTDDGLVRLSLTHYNNLKDSEKVIEALQKV